MGVSHINICISTAPSNFATRIGIGKFEPGRAVGSSSIVLMPVSPAYFELMTPKAPTKHLIHVESRRPWLPAGDVGAPTPEFFAALAGKERVCSHKSTNHRI